MEIIDTIIAALQYAVIASTPLLCYACKRVVDDLNDPASQAASSEHHAARS